MSPLLDARRQFDFLLRRQELDLPDLAQVELDGGVAVVAGAFPLARGKQLFAFGLRGNGRPFHFLGLEDFLGDRFFNLSGAPWLGAALARSLGGAWGFGARAGREPRRGFRRATR